MLPDGQRQQWRLTSPKDLDRILNANKLGGSALVNKSIEPPLVITAAQEVDENEVYHVLPPWHSSRFRSNVTIWLPSEDDEGPVKCIFPTITQPILTSLLATMGVAGVRSADQPDGVTLADISLLEDGAEYFGNAMKASTLRSAVGKNSFTVRPVDYVSYFHEHLNVNSQSICRWRMSWLWPAVAFHMRVCA